MRQTAQASFRVHTTGRDRIMAARARLPMKGYLSRGGDVLAQFWRLDGSPVQVVFPLAITKLLNRCLIEVRQGRSVTIVAEGSLLTTQEAANHLGISRSHLIRLLEAGALTFIWVGRERRLLLEEVEEYRQRLQGSWGRKYR